MGKKDGSITVPLCLALTALAVFILGLLEAVRYDGLSMDAKEWANLVAESLFAGYQPVLFDEYRMFLLDGGFGKGVCDIGRMQDEMEALAGDNFLPGEKNTGVNFYRMQTAGVEIPNYRLVTDEQGKVFIMQAAKAMKGEISLRAAEVIKERIENTDKKSQEGGNPEDFIAGANAALKGIAEEEGAKDAAQAEGAVRGQSKEVPADSLLQEDAPQKNLLEIIKALRQQGILTLVLPKGKTCSSKEISVDNCLLKRDCAKGSYKQGKNPGWYERILMQEFMKPLVGNAVQPKESGALSYGIEYIICGKGSDKENLKGVAKKLVLMREGLNFLYLQQDGAKQAQALSAAAAIAGASVNPAVIHAVKEGILAAWAYMESICDVRALLSGGKIPLIKDAACWQTQLMNLENALAGEYKGETNGMSYENYLDALLYLKTAKHAAYRCMDLMEHSLRSTKGYEACRMDTMLVGMKAKSEYHANTLFWGLLGTSGIGGYQFLEEVSYIYGE